jgi:hypothetical protein
MEGFYSYLENINFLLRAVLLNLQGVGEVDVHCPLPYKAHALRFQPLAGQILVFVDSVFTH